MNGIKGKTEQREGVEEGMEEKRGKGGLRKKVSWGRVAFENKTANMQLRGVGIPKERKRKRHRKKKNKDKQRATTEQLNVA